MFIRTSSTTSTAVTASEIAIRASGSPIRTSPTVSSASAAANTIPAGTSTLTLLFRLPGGLRMIHSAATAVTGMLSQNAHSHDSQVVIPPPQRGPNTPPASALAPMSPYAIARCLPSTNSLTAAIEIGMMAPPPIAWNTRMPTSQLNSGGPPKSQPGICGDIATSAEPSVNTPSAARNARR